MPHALILGCGYVGLAFGRALVARGWSVTGTARSAEGLAAIACAGFAPLAAEAGAHAHHEAAREASVVLQSAPPGADGDPAPTWLAGALRADAWVGYLSTTGVYGDRAGGWAFEDEAPTPASPEATRRAAAEAAWRALEPSAHVFRLPGIYGPGRSAIEQVAAGSARRIVKPGQVFSRIHRDDIVAGLLASIARPNPGRIFNLCDDRPGPPGDPVAEAARLLGVAAPPEVAFEDAGLSPMARRFYAETKRVSNARAKAELGWRPAFPTFREGLADCLARAPGPGEPAAGA